VSKYKCSHGDDYPDAAAKNLTDGRVLFGNARYDGAGYHAGYVVECVLKTLLQLDNQFLCSHDLSRLSQKALGLAGLGSSNSARYIKALPTRLPYGNPPHGWRETLRYCSEGVVDEPTATQWLSEADRMYQGVVSGMKKDGLI